MNSIKVSIIVPCYNSGKFITETLDSITNQTCQDWECIIVDDGSTDETVKVVRHYIYNDSRFRLYTQENQGAPTARNRGVLHAQGEYIMFLDSDDIILENKLLFQLDILENNHDVGVVYCDGYCFTQFDNHCEISEMPVPAKKEFGLVKAQDMFRQLFFANRLTIHSALIRKNIINKYGAFLEDLFHHEDHELWLRIARHGINFYSMPQKLVLYRKQTTSMSTGRANMRLGEARALRIHKHHNAISRYAVRVKERDVLKWLVRDLIKARRFDEAKHYLSYYFSECTNNQCPYIIRGVSLWIRVYITRK